jgi:hypothetical protein
MVFIYLFVGRKDLDLDEKDADERPVEDWQWGRMISSSFVFR